MATIPVETPSPKMFCGECGGSYPVEDLARFGNTFVCVNCKSGYVQRMREGVQPLGSTLAGAQYGGFWIRGLALFLDGLIVIAISTPLFFIAALTSGGLAHFDPQNPSPAAAGMFVLAYLVLFALVIAYNVWFVSQKGGTLGKLALGLRIVTTDGRTLTVGRALGRYFALALNGFTLYIGFIIAAFDAEKRALHDHICSTRVIRK